MKNRSLISVIVVASALSACGRYRGSGIALDLTSFTSAARLGALTAPVDRLSVRVFGSTFDETQVMALTDPAFQKRTKSKR